MIRKGKYLHYKGKEYEVLGQATHSETREQMVIYKPLYKLDGDSEQEQLWVRPMKMFTEEIEVEGNIVARFAYTGN